MDKALRNTLRNVVTQCRKELEKAVAEMLEGQFGIYASGKLDDATGMSHLSAEDQEYRSQLLVHLEHIQAGGFIAKDAAEQLIREVAFTHLNRFCAYKMMEVRKLIRESVSRGYASNNVKFYLAEHPEDEQLYNSGHQATAYRHFLEWLGGTLSEEIGVLFSPHDPANRLLPPQRVLDQVLELLNSEALKDIWAEDETIGWIYQYFTPDEVRRQARKDNPVPQNSYELSFRNQFYTPSYVVQFLTDNTLGRTWYEMRRGETALTEQCQYLVRRQEDPISHRAKKDPREIRVLDPACGSGHFLLYCFTLLQTIYDEAYDDPEFGGALQQDYPDRTEFRQAVPGLILAHNLHGIDIDIRATQIAALALWLRAQRAYQEMGLKKERPKITKSNLVCAEPMPGEAELLEEFIAELPSEELRRLVRNVFDKMTLAGEAGSLLKIEDEIQTFIKEILRPEQLSIFDAAASTDQEAWSQLEEKAKHALRSYAEKAVGTQQLQRQLFSNDAVQGFAFIDLCLKSFDVVLMNPPFGDASLPSKPYIEEVYGDTKGDVYKTFVECFQDRLVPCGMLGIISSRTGFFLGQSSDWRERVLLRLYRPLLLADLGYGVLDAMVETAAYVLRNLSEEEERNLTLSIIPSLQTIKLDKEKAFSIPTYQKHRSGLKRHQAYQELERLQKNGYVRAIEGHHLRFAADYDQVKEAPEPEPLSYPALICIRLLNDKNQEAALLEALNYRNDPRLFTVSPEDFAQIPNSPFAYWAGERVLEAFRKFKPLEGSERLARIGLTTHDDFRWLRLWWEVDPDKIGSDKEAPLFAKGGAYSPIYADIFLTVQWGKSGQLLKNSKRERLRIGELTANNSKCWNESLYFRPGITWTARSQKGLNTRVMPSGCIFSHKGPAIFVKNDHPVYLLALLSITNTSIFRFLVDLQMAFGSYEAGVIQRTPIPDLSTKVEEELSQLALLWIDIKRSLESANEISHIFYIPALLHLFNNTLVERIQSWQQKITESEQQFADYQQQIDNIAFQLYGIAAEDRTAIESTLSRQSANVEEDEDNEEDAINEPITTKYQSLTTALFSYLFGCIFGRWDIRFITGKYTKPELPDPFAPLPVYSPGMLTPDSDLTDYPIELDRDGVLVDDPDHPDDIIRRIRNVLEVIWSDNADAIEQEACEILGVKDLRDYFRKPGNGGFWQDHIKRYSKSRRKAPIYWLLQSSKKSYALWLYYHRLDKDILFKAHTQYVKPKLNLETDKLNQLNNQRATLSGTALKQLERDIEKQESLVSELTDFSDKLQRAAKLDFGRNLNQDVVFDPDLNDGVVLNIAPLWELTPWSEAKKYWQDLIQGKYEWSSIGRQLRAKGIVQC